jgi:hypothetical protein
VLSAATSARAAVIALTPGDFGGATLITFNGIPDFTPINGQVVNGVLFNYLVNNVASSDAVIDGGPGVTNNIAPPDVVNNLGNANAILRLTFPVAQVRLGYGFAILDFVDIPNATTVSLYNASNVLVGTLSANGTPNPLFTGGFLGLQSTLPFVRADVTFSTQSSIVPGGAFAFDNVRFAPTAVPEPASLVLLGIGVAGASARRLRKRHS